MESLPFFKINLKNTGYRLIWLRWQPELSKVNVIDDMLPSLPTLDDRPSVPCVGYSIKKIQHNQFALAVGSFWPELKDEFGRPGLSFYHGIFCEQTQDDDPLWSVAELLLSLVHYYQAESDHVGRKIELAATELDSEDRDNFLSSLDTAYYYDVESVKKRFTPDIQNALKQVSPGANLVFSSFEKSTAIDDPVSSDDSAELRRNVENTSASFDEDVPIVSLLSLVLNGSVGDSAAGGNISARARRLSRFQYISVPESRAPASFAVVDISKIEAEQETQENADAEVQAANKVGDKLITQQSTDSRDKISDDDTKHDRDALIYQDISASYGEQETESNQSGGIFTVPDNVDEKDDIKTVPLGIIRSKTITVIARDGGDDFITELINASHYTTDIDLFSFNGPQAIWVNSDRFDLRKIFENIANIDAQSLLIIRNGQTTVVVPYDQFAQPGNGIVNTSQSTEPEPDVLDEAQYSNAADQGSILTKAKAYIQKVIGLG